MTNVTDIKTANWQISVKGIGEVEQGANDINQCIAIILATQKGSDPLRPDFGVDLLTWIDRPNTEVGPGLTKEIIEQIAAYEPRVDLKSVAYMTPDERVIFSLAWSYKAEDAPQGFSITKGSTPHVRVYFLLTNENGFVLLDDNSVALILN